MWNESAVAREILAIFAEHLLAEVESPETDLIENGILDSVELVSLLAQIEKHFDITIAIDDLEADNIRSVREIARVVVNEVNGSQPSYSAPAS